MPNENRLDFYKNNGKNSERLRNSRAEATVRRQKKTFSENIFYTLIVLSID